MVGECERRTREEKRVTDFAMAFDLSIVEKEKWMKRESARYTSQCVEDNN